MGFRRKVIQYKYPSFVFIGLLSTLAMYQNFIPSHRAAVSSEIRLGEPRELMRSSIHAVYAISGESIAGNMIQEVRIDPETGQIASIDVIDSEDPTLIRTLYSKEIAEIVY